MTCDIGCCIVTSVLQCYNVVPEKSSAAARWLTVVFGSMSDSECGARAGAAHPSPIFRRKSGRRIGPDHPRGHELHNYHQHHHLHHQNTRLLVLPHPPPSNLTQQAAKAVPPAPPATTQSAPATSAKPDTAIDPFLRERQHFQLSNTLYLIRTRSTQTIILYNTRSSEMLTTAKSISAKFAELLEQ